MNRGGQLGELVVFALIVLAIIGVMYLFDLPRQSASRQECVYECGLEGLELKEWLMVNSSLRCLCQDNTGVVVIG